MECGNFNWSGQIGSTTRQSHHRASRQHSDQQFPGTMTVVRNTPFAIGLFRRWLLCLSSLRPAVLAAVILATPGATTFASPEFELSESSNPAEDRGDVSEFVATAGSAAARRSIERSRHACELKRDAVGSTRLRESGRQPVRCVTGHRLANGICAPLLC